MSILTTTPATLDDLLKVDGKAELIGGRIVRFMPSGFAPNRVALLLVMSLELWSRRIGRGYVLTDGIGFAIRPPLTSGRQSFSPDVSYYDGPLPQQRMRFIEGPPLFAVEVRSESDYKPAAERDMAEKRADYFEAGTKIVWDVDPLAREVRAYLADSPAQPRIFTAGQTADAEPVLAGWRVTVDELFA